MAGSRILMRMADFIWDLFQQQQIHDTQEEARNTGHKVASTQGDLAELTERVERLSLVCQAMWELLSQHTKITSNELMRKVVEVDTRDGRNDGKIAPRVIQCPKCKNNVNTRHPRCVVCGSVIATKHPFEV
jgi:rRNA maturation endonuclease Nob1